MEERLVTYQTAKLFKEDGFDWEVRESLVDTTPYNGEFDINDVHVYQYKQNHNRMGHRISLPTQSFGQKWLREKHHIDVYAEPTIKDGSVVWIGKRRRLDKVMDMTFIDISAGVFNTYEDALENAIKETLKNLNQ